MRLITIQVFLQIGLRFELFRGLTSKGWKTGGPRGIPSTYFQHLFSYMTSLLTSFLQIECRM